MFVAAVVCACSSRTGLPVKFMNARCASCPPSGAIASLASGSGDPNSASLAVPSGGLDFTLVNLSGLEIHAVYVSPHDSLGWEENIIGSDQLEDGEAVDIRFNPDEKHAMWDLRVVDNYGNNAEWRDLSLREISKITIRTSLNQEDLQAEAEIASLNNSAIR